MSKQNEEKKPLTVWQKISLNIKIIVLIVVLILIGFFAIYMYKTSLDDVLGKENQTDDGLSAAAVTTVYINGGDSSAAEATDSEDISDNDDGITDTDDIGINE